jgi:uncharacterized protein involved in response to NO
VPLMLLVLLWLCGRLAWAPFPGAAPWLLQAAGLAFFPVLGAILAAPLIRARNFRNLPFLIVLALLFVADLAQYAQQFAWPLRLPLNGQSLAVNLVMLLVVVVGGRIVPAFTRNALRALQRPSAITPAPRLDALCIGATVAVLAVDVIAPGSPVAGALAAATALLLGWRLARWQGWRTIDVPLLWVLHVGYAWLVVALALKAAWLLASAAWAIYWMHAFTAGAFGTMILGVTTRATLGHTGRPLAASRFTAVAYVLVTLAVLVRVFVPPLVPAWFVAGLATASSLWIAAFLIYLVIYAPMFFRPRVDGRPG